MHSFDDVLDMEDDFKRYANFAHESRIHLNRAIGLLNEGKTEAVSNILEMLIRKTAEL